MTDDEQSEKVTKTGNLIAVPVFEARNTVLRWAFKFVVYLLRIKAKVYWEYQEPLDGGEIKMFRSGVSDKLTVMTQPTDNGNLLFITETHMDPWVEHPSTMDL